MENNRNLDLLMNTVIFIVTHAKDFPWLKYCLRSISKFARDFSSVTILVPSQDYAMLLDNLVDVDEMPCWPNPFRVTSVSADQWPGLGMLWHEAQIMRADQWCPAADFIAHFDPDCIFTAPVTPETFMVDGRPILRYERFETIGRRWPAVLRWKEAAEACLPFPVEAEFMRGHPEIYHRGLYAYTRNLIVQKTGKLCDDYIRSCRNEFPQTFCEFCTLGAVACEHFQELYHLHDCATQPNPDFQPFPVQQFWSHGDIAKSQDIWVRGEQKGVVPIEMMKQFGLV